MNILIITFFIIVIIITIYLIDCKRNENFINYTIKNKTYKVIENIDNHNDAADILHKIDETLIILINYINSKYDKFFNKKESNDSNDYNSYIKEKENFIKEIILKLNKRYDSNSLQENIPNEPMKDVSYNINKGELMSICIRKYEDIYKFHNFNDILFVSIHELAHSCNKGYGHDKKFWKIFRFILENAVENKLFKNINYNKYPVKYCSMSITYNPIFDKSLDDKYYFKYS